MGGADKIGVTKLNEILQNNMPNSWSKKVYLQVFYCEYNTLKESINMFEHMDIVEYIYKSVVEFSYKKTNRLYATRSGCGKL